MTILNSMHHNPPKAGEVGKFIALYIDGSGAKLCMLLDSGKIMGADGDIDYGDIDYENIDSMQENFMYWIDITNEYYTYFYEK